MQVSEDSEYKPKRARPTQPRSQPMMRLDPLVRARIADDRDLWSDFNRICDCRGRLAGTASERRALALIKQCARQAAGGIAGRSLPVPYGGWSARRAELRLPDGSTAPCHPLVRTIATSPAGLDAEVVDLGRGTPDEFEAHRSDIDGRIVLVRHELMFAAGTIHRRRKYEMARKAGAAGFLIAGPQPGALVAGSCGRVGCQGIPAAGISPETANQLRRRADGWRRATLMIETTEAPAESETHIIDIPGETDEWVALSAHVDGHDLAESAMDNATGLAAALGVIRALAPEIRKYRRGVRLAFFSVEEWALTGSARYVQSLSEEERKEIVLNINLAARRSPRSPAVLPRSSRSCCVSPRRTGARFVYSAH